MTHAARASRTPVGTRMAAVPAGLVITALAGIVYGFWTSGVDRAAAASPITGWNVLLGFVTAIAFAAVAYTIHTLAPRLPREARALAWAAFAGVSFGFLYSLSDASVLKSSGLSLVVAAGVFAVVFYRYYTTED